MKSLRLACLLAPLVVLMLLFGARPALADTNTDVVAGLNNTGAYISDQAVVKKHTKPGDYARIKAQVDRASNQGIDEDIAITGYFRPNVFPSAAVAASRLRTYLDFSGVLILVSPKGIGISSDTLNSSEDTAIARQVVAICTTQSWTDCAIRAAQLAETRARNDANTSYRNAYIFWIIFLIVLALLFAALLWYFSRRRRQVVSDVANLRSAALTTLGNADASVQQIEAAGPLKPEARAEYDRALGLRNRARQEIEHASGAAGLIQANEDAAQAVLALQGVMRQAGIAKAENPLDLGERRCFYCGRTDRPPYITRTIEDGRGNSMTIDICAVDAEHLQRGQTPPIATVRYGGAMVPWWAVPGNPWYGYYGGPAWQHWLPFAIGIDVGSWLGGGWQTYGYYDGLWDPGVGAGIGPVGPGGVGTAGGTPSDAGGVDFGGWGGGPDSTPSDAGGADFGGWGDSGDSGGADFGGNDNSGW